MNRRFNNFGCAQDGNSSWNIPYHWENLGEDGDVGKEAYDGVLIVIRGGNWGAIGKGDMGWGNFVRNFAVNGLIWESRRGEKVLSTWLGMEKCIGKTHACAYL